MTGSAAGRLGGRQGQGGPVREGGAGREGCVGIDLRLLAARKGGAGGLWT